MLFVKCQIYTGALFEQLLKKIIYLKYVWNKYGYLLLTNHLKLVYNFILAKLKGRELVHIKK